jgi:hypothetical protein
VREEEPVGTRRILKTCKLELLLRKKNYKYTYITEHLMRSENEKQMGHEEKDKRNERSAYMI